MKTWTDFLIEQTHEFSCVLAPIPESLAKDICSWEKGFIDKDDLYIGETDTGFETDVHVTILYGLHGDNASEVQELLAQEKPIDLTFGKTSIFSNDDYDVVKFSIESEDLQRLNKLLRKNCEYTSTHPTYVPHCTIAYVQKGKGKKYVGNMDFSNKKITISEVVFSSANGSKTVIRLMGTTK